jgi:uncharacterized protein with HEPN domain
MNQRSLRVWLVDIREEIAGIRDLTKNTDLVGFAGSWGMKRAVEHALLIIAEAAKHLPDELKDKHPEVPWPKFMALEICFAMSTGGLTPKYCGQS